MGFTPFGQVLQMQGGSLQQKVGSVFAEKLKMVKALEGGDLGSLLGGLMGSGGLSSIMSGNPLSGVLSQLQSAVTQMLSQVGGASNGSAATADANYPLSQVAVTALSAATTAFKANTDGLSGVGQPAPYGPIDVILHATNVGALGTSPSPALTLATVVAPLGASAAVVAANVNASAAISGLVAGTTSDDVAAAIVTQAASSLSSLTAASSNAIVGLQSALPVLATAQAIAAATVSDMPDLLSYVSGIVQPEVLAQLKTTAEAEFYVAPPVITTLAPLINVNNLAYSAIIPMAGFGGIETIEVV